MNLIHLLSNFALAHGLVNTEYLLAQLHFLLRQATGLVEMSNPVEPHKFSLESYTGLPSSVCVVDCVLYGFISVQRVEVS